MLRFTPMLRVVSSLVLVCALGHSGWAAEQIAPWPDERELVAASGVATVDIDPTCTAIEQLAEEFAARHRSSGDLRTRAASIHEFLHRRAFTGKYRADASDLHAAIHGGPFNCAATSALFLHIARDNGLEACAVSTPGHVWCRVRDGHETLDIETTCRDWFAIADRCRGLGDEHVSPAMIEHRRRVRIGRELSDREFLAVFHFNRGVSLIERKGFEAAIDANLEALACDPLCRPASQNLAAVVMHLCTRPQATLLASGRLLLRILTRESTTFPQETWANPQPANSVLTSTR